MFYFSRQCNAHEQTPTHTHIHKLHLSVPTRVRVRECKRSFVINSIHLQDLNDTSKRSAQSREMKMKDRKSNDNTRSAFNSMYVLCSITLKEL